ncbi:right-handed parallel beta-helix repeat-containing protein [Tateyamaria sp. syn59]|uniref:right-handed parallel beta-helix repeat-containing protein n=1 Tax=Tateyamaria sp. syn59 TaxID=2576942 RepID=UPI0011BF0977|nr:right-handed parallel beta-helix repeat-containing protein [Tateyamaria sp. syn59]
MARSCQHSWRSVLAALLVVFAPQTALGDLGAVDLSDLRKTLAEIDAELAEDRGGPVDVEAIWSRLFVPAPVQFPDVPTEQPAAPQPARSFLFGEAPQATTGAAAGLRPAGALFGSAPPAPVATAATPGLGLAGVSAAAPSAAVDVGTVNFRLFLASLAQVYTGENNQAVVNAQGPAGPVALSVTSGTVTLRDLQSFSALHGRAPRMDGTLTMPVVIWPGATLRLSPGERLALARDSGAFVLSMGTLDIEGATVEVAGQENSFTPSFVPFVTVIGGGSLIAKNATFRGLGFGNTAKFSGLSVAGDLINQGKGRVVIEDSRFDALKVVSLANIYGAELTGNTFYDARNNTLNLINAPHARVEGNLFAGRSPTNAIRVETGSSHAQVSRNIFLHGERVAVLVDRGSDHVEVQDNLVWNRAGAGVKFLGTRCGLAHGNLILDNDQKGIEVRKSDGTVVRDNLVVGNGSAGIWVSAQRADARTSVTGNIFRANGAGLAAATGAEIEISQNDFARQLPRLLDGDIARLTGPVARDLTGTGMVRFKNGQAETLGEMSTLCGSAS